MPGCSPNVKIRTLLIIPHYSTRQLELIGMSIEKKLVEWLKSYCRGIFHENNPFAPLE
jgi:hypothetical protein